MDQPDHNISSEDPLLAPLIAGERRALSRAITLVESTRPDHRDRARALMNSLPARAEPALRIGLSGTPGVGKSTFIETFGLYLIDLGLRVAVLAVDPSSTRSGGSILGDKTRMDHLSRAPEAFIRPSPSRATLGGVAQRTRDAVLLSEAAGYDIILVETVGVGQSETLVADMTDLFVLLLAPAGGDELQGVKRGIMETADIILVNKADGVLRDAAMRTFSDYSGALRLLRKRPRDPDGYPCAMTVSAMESTGLEEAWSAMTDLIEWRRDSGVFLQIREEQAVSAFEMEVDHRLRHLMRARGAADWATYRASVQSGAVLPDEAAAAFVEALFSGPKLPGDPPGTG